MKRLLSVSLFVTAALCGSLSKATSATGIVKMKVLRPLQVEAKAPIAFVTATPGSDIDRIEPGDPNSGQFLIRGEPNTAFQIRLPENIIMTNNQGFQDQQIIVVKEFTSFPANSGKLSTQGDQLLFIGATRNALPVDQEVGSYTGSYTIDIIY